MTKQINDATGHYKPYFKNWPKALGAKPTAELLATVHHLGARPGKQALANAMMLRPEGASASQIVMACGAPQLNKMRELVARHLVKRDMNVAANEAGHTVYKITLAAKGEAMVKKASEAPAAEGATPAKAKRKAKAKPATVTPPQGEATPAPEVDATAQA